MAESTDTCEVVEVVGAVVVVEGGTVEVVVVGATVVVVVLGGAPVVVEEAEGELPHPARARARATVARVTPRPIVSLRPPGGRFRLLGMRQPAIGRPRWGGFTPTGRRGPEALDPGSRKKSRNI
jgi:hypothetical protein